LSALNFKIFSNSQILFHLSFTVLLHYQTSKFLDFEGGPPNFKQSNYTALLIVKNILFILQGYYLLRLNLLNKQNIFKVLYYFRSPLLTASRLIFLL